MFLVPSLNMIRGFISNQEFRNFRDITNISVIVQHIFRLLPPPVSKMGEVMFLSM